MAPPPMANPPKRKSSQSSPSSSSVSLPVSGIALGLLAGLGVAIAARWTHSHKQKRKNSTPNTPPHQAPMFTDPARSSTDVINNDQERGEDDEDCRLLELPCPPLSTGPVGACLAEYDLLLQTSSLIDDGDSLHHEAAMARTCVTSTERPHENTIPAQNHGHPSATEAAQQCLGAPMQPWTLQSQSVLSSARHGGNTGSFAELDQKQDPSSSVLVEGENVLGGSIAVSEGLSDAGLDRDAKAMGTVSAAEDYSEDDFRAMQDGSLVPDIEGDSENRFPAMGDDCGDGFHHKGVPLQRWEMQVPKESADSAAVSESESGLDGDTKDMTTVSATESNSGHCFPTMEDGSGGRFPAIEDDTGSDFPAMEDGSGVLDREEDSRVDFPAMEEGSRDPDKGYESGNRFLVVDDKFGDGSLLRECVPSQIPAVQSPPVVSPSHHGRDSGSSVEREGQKQQSSVLKEEEENESAASSAAASEGFSDSAANGGAKVAGTVFSGHGFLAIEDDPEERLEESSGERYPAVKEDSGDDFPAMQDCSGHPDMENGNRFTTVEDNIGNSPVLREGVTLQTSEVLSPSVVSPSCDGHNGGSSVEPDEQQQQHEQPSSLPIQEEEDKSGGCGAASERFSELAFGGYAKGVSTVSSVEENTGHDFLVAIEDSSGERVPTVTEGSGDDCTAMEDGSSGPDKEDDLRHDFPATENVSGDPDKRDDSGNCFTVVEDNLGDSSCFREGVFLQRLEVQIPSVVFHSRVPTVMEDSGDDCTAMEDGSSGPDKEDDLGHDFPATENVSGDPDKTDDSRNCFTVVEDNLGDSSCFQEGVSLQRLEVQIPSVGFPSRVPTVTDDSGDDCTAMEDGSAGPDKEDDLGHDFPAAENVSGDPDKTDDSGNCFTVVEDNLGDSSRFREGASLQRLEVQIPSVVFPSHSVHNGEPSVEQQQEQQEQKQPSSVLIKEWENESAGSSAASERFSASILNGDAKDASTVSAMEDGSGHDFHAIGDVSGERFLAMEDDSMECILSMKEDSGDDILAMEDGSASPVHPDTEEGSGDADIEEDSGNHFPVLEDSLGGSSLVDDGIPSERWEVQNPSVVPPLCHGCNRGSSVEQEQKQPSTVLIEDGKNDSACCITASESFSESALNGDDKDVGTVSAVEDDSGNGFPAMKDISGERFLAMENGSGERFLAILEDSRDDCLVEYGSGHLHMKDDSGNRFLAAEDNSGDDSFLREGIPSHRWYDQTPSVVPLQDDHNSGPYVEQEQQVREQKQPSSVLIEDGKNESAGHTAVSVSFSESGFEGEAEGVDTLLGVEDDSVNFCLAMEDGTGECLLAMEDVLGDVPANPHHGHSILSMAINPNSYAESLQEPICLITRVEDPSDACILADEGSSTQSVVKGSHEACAGSDVEEDMPTDGCDVHTADPPPISVTMLLHHSSSFSTDGGYPSLPMTLDDCSVNGHSPAFPLHVDEPDSLHFDGDPAAGSTSSMGSNTEGELNPQFTVQGFHEDVSLAAVGSTGSLDRNTDGELNPQSILQESHKDVHLITANDESHGKSVMDDNSSTSSNSDGDHDHRSTASIFNNDGFSWQNSESTVEASVEIDDCCLSDHGYSHLKLSSERFFHDSFAIGLSELPSTGDSLDDVDSDIDSGAIHYNTVAALFDDNKEHKLPSVSGDTNCFMLRDDVEHDIQSSINGYDEPSIMHKEAIVRTFGHEDALVQAPEKNNPAAIEYHNTCLNAYGDYTPLTADVHMIFQSAIEVCEKLYPHDGVEENKPLMEKSDNTSMNVVGKPESIVVNACGVLLTADGCDDLHLSLEQCDTCAGGNSTFLSVMQDPDDQYENQAENECVRACTSSNEDHEDDSTSASLIRGNMPDVQSTIHGTDSGLSHAGNFDQCINCSAENHVVQPKMEHNIWSSDDGSPSFPSNILVDDERQRSVISKASSGGSSLCQSAVEHTDTATFFSEINHQTKTGRSNELPQSVNGNTSLQQDDIDESDARNYSTTGKSANDISSMSAVEVEFNLQSVMADGCLNLHAGPKQLGSSSDELTDFQQSYLQKPDSSGRLSSESPHVQSTTEKPNEKHYFYQSIIKCRIDENGDHPFPESIMSQCDTSADSESNHRLSAEDCDETTEEIGGETFPHSNLDHSFHSDVSKFSILHTMTDDIATDEIISDNCNVNNSEDECMRCMVKPNTVDPNAVDLADEHTPGVNGLGQRNENKHAVDAIDRMDDKHSDVRPVVTGVTEVGISDEAVRKVKDGNTFATTLHEEAQEMEWQPRSSGLAGDIKDTNKTLPVNKRRKRRRRGAKREEQASDATYGGTFSPVKDGVRRIETFTPYIVLGIGALCLLVSVINIVLHYLQTSQPLVNREEF